MILLYFIPIVELLLSIVYIAINWQVSYDSDFLIDGIICFLYITLHLIYCLAKIFVLLMWKASGMKERLEICGRRFVALQLLWGLFAIMILLLFGTIFNLVCCVPVLLPNCLYLLYVVVKNVYK